MGFVKYTEYGRSYAAKASISKSGMLSLSHGARKRFSVDAYQLCVLYFDPDTRRVGIELTNNAQAEGARKVRLRKTGADVAIKSYMDFFDLAVTETTVYTPQRDAETGWITIDLREGRKKPGKRAAAKADTA